MDGGSDKVRELVAETFTIFRRGGRVSGIRCVLLLPGRVVERDEGGGVRRVTYDLTMAAAQAVLKANPVAMTFVYVSGAGTDAKGRRCGRG